MTASTGNRMVNKSTGKGRIALITGCASKGMGREFALALAHEGAQVVVSDIPTRQKEGEELVSQIKGSGGTAIWVPLDVTTEDAWDAAINEIEAQFGVLDVLVNNAGVANPEAAFGGIETLTLDQWRKTQAINTEGVFLGHKYAIRSMKKNTASEACSIVNMSSRAGLSGASSLISYSASKWAVRGMTKSFAGYCSEKGYKIRVNSVHPGIIRTDMTRGMGWYSQGDEPLAPVETIAMLKRSADAKEVANLVLYLSSDESSYSNASEFVVDGGWPQ
ncbi:short-chain dehydrogenase/reductase SDR [Gonapodya prolifera JEL478]|uniref:Short-chain dehydrogenase/reductase SDR n=1 Tax=Gonapodya prolifera (strain JEL478) TaxID=1344416 RepID=A0A138ZWK7_GONPJ|nr:short-chain dehydrogenase/reductase SDR [Gonapodya prolifera JEL478]|eukprot:KXS08834.1 short-chain dehydrogenase/reductase SDR [Gonapodya prolifera JEL478]